MPYLGGFEITSCAWLDTHSLGVWFTSTYTDKIHQLYCGRQLIGETSNTSDRLVIGSMVPTLWPEHITVLAVETSEAGSDFGSLLPDRPYNRAKISTTVSGWTDAKYIDVTAGTTAGGAVSDSNLIHREFYDTDRTYTMVVPSSDTFHGSGTWNLEVTGRDDRPGGGNLGTAKTLSVDVLSHPPDVTLQPDSSRFSITVSGGTLTVNFTEAPE